MVLKRLIFTVLGLAGLLGVGTAMAQEDGTPGMGGIPAPKLFSDVTGCTTELPSARNKKYLDGLFTGTPSELNSAARTRLQATLDPCNDDGTANAISRGFDTARDLYEDTADAKSLTTGDGVTQDDRDRFRDAQEKQDDYGGAVYTLVYREEAAKKAVETAIKDWNEFFTDTRSAPTDAPDADDDGAYVVAEFAYSAVAVNNLRLVDSDGDGDRAGTRQTGTELTDRTDDAYFNPYGIDQVEGFQAVTGFDVATLDWDTDGDGTIEESEFATVDATINAAFDTAGKLDYIDAQTVTNTRNAPNTDDSVEGSTTINTLGIIADHVDHWEKAARDAQKIVDDADPETATDYDSLKRRAARIAAIRDHVNSEKARLEKVIKSENRPGGAGGSDTTDVAIIRNYENVIRRLGTAETRVRNTAAELESATKNVKTALEDPKSYLSQLVRLRNYERAELDELYDNDPPESLVEEADGLVDKAVEQQEAHAELTGGTDNPAGKLITELTKTEDEDDGLALVTAVSDTYKAAQNAEKVAMDAKAKADEVAEMIGDGSAVEGNTMKIGENAGDIMELDGRVTENETDIAANEADIADLNMELYGPTSSQHSDAVACAEGAGGLVNIAKCAAARSRHNEQDIADLGGDVEVLEGRVDDNEDAIAMNAEGIMTNAADIATNAEHIMTNMGNIAMNSEGIMTNMGNIAMNSEGIMTNMGNIAMNSEGIMTNMGNIAMNSEGIMTNAGNIAMNSEYIMANSGKISSNADAIAANMNSIGQNSAMISDNRNMIGELSDDLGVVRAGVAASMALAGMPAVNGRGIAIGVGSFDGESAFAVGFQIQGEQASFKVGVTSGGGATGASAGVGFNF